MSVRAVRAESAAGPGGAQGAAQASKGSTMNITMILAMILITALTAFADDVEVIPPRQDTVLLDGAGRAAVIARMDDPAIAAVAEQVAGAIGQGTEIIDDETVLGLNEAVADHLTDRPLVLVGNALNNRAIYRLYIRELALCDADYPGAGGWIVRTVSDPWRAGRNAVIVGASNETGLRVAARAFEEALVREDDTVTLPWGWRFRSAVDGDGDPRYAPEEYTEADWAAYQEQITWVDQPIKSFPVTIINEANAAADRYFHTRSEDELRRFKMAIDELRRIGDEIEVARRVEFRLKDLVIAWERIEAAPFFSQQDRNDVAQFLYSVGLLWEQHYWSAPMMTDRVRVVGAMYNHSSNGTLGYLRLAMYLNRRCELSDAAAEDAARWLDSAVDVFGVQEKSFKPREDANGYQWWTVKHMLKYAMWRPDLEIFWNGNVRLITDLMLAAADNRGAAAAYGDTGGGLSGYTSHAQYICLLAARHYGDGCAHWIAEYLGGSHSDAEMTVEALEPVDQTGIVKIPWSRSIYDTKAEADSACARVPWHRTFDKIAFRDSFDAESAYMLLDGIGGMNHGHDDCNSIIRVSAHDTVWLADASPPLKTMYDHNGVFVARDGRSPVEAYTAELQAFTDGLTLGMTRTQSPANGLMWNRNIFWAKGGYFVVIDNMECETAGDYQANCIWRSPHEGTLEGRNYVVPEGDHTMVIASDGTGDSKVGWERQEQALNAHVLREIVSAEMTPGDRLVYANSVSWPQSGDSPRLSRVAEDAWRFEQDGEATLVAIGPDTPEEVETDAGMLMVTPQGVCVSGATECTLAGAPVLTATDAVDMELTRDGRALVLCDTRTSVSLPIAGEVLVNGNAQSPSRPGNLTTIDLAPGRHVIEGTGGTVAGLFTDFQRAMASWEALETEAAEAAEDVPVGGETMWTYDRLREFVPLDVARVSADPPCKEGRSSPIQQIVDGNHGGSGVSCVWQRGEEPVVTMDLGQTRTIDQVDVYTWEGMDNNRLAGVKMWIADRDEAERYELIADDMPIVGQAERDISRIRRLEGLDVKARYVKMQFMPAGPDHAPYVAEAVFYPPRSQRLGQGEINDIATADINSDGADEVLIAGSDKKIHCIGRDGELLWHFEADEPFGAVWAGDVDGRMVILAGCDDNHLYRLSADGEVTWKQRTYDYRTRPDQTGKVKQIEVAQLKSDADPVILAGADNWHLSAFTLAGEELWHCWYYAHRTTFITTGDVDGDGDQEIFQGTSFADTNWFETDGDNSYFQFTHMSRCTDGVTADLDEDGLDEMIAAGQKGIVATTAHRDDQGEWDWREEWRIETGCPQTSVVVTDVDGDGVEDIVTAGKNGFIQAIGAGGEPHWIRNADNSISDLLIAPLSGAEVILAASDDETVQVWSKTGELLRRIQVGKRMERLLVGDVDGDGALEVLAKTPDNVLHVVKP